MSPRNSESTDNQQFTTEKIPTGVDSIFGMYDSKLAVANDTFEPVQKGEDLIETGKRLKEKFGGELNAFDPMGQGTRMLELGATKTLAVSLEFNRALMQENVDRESITELSGKLQDQSTWDQIHQWTQENGDFGLIICTPGDGVKYFWNQEYGSPETKLTLFSDFVFNLVNTLRIGGELLLESQAEVRMILRYIQSENYSKFTFPVHIEYNPVLSLLKITRLELGEQSIVERVSALTNSSQ